ncbi:MAG: 50S ribosomal protein L11 methyltransferase [Sinobacteraceae bacterium]|nr:50S ribosomal protein L11 methyltransferase [Nevskiaceae bacterium]
MCGFWQLSFDLGSIEPGAAEQSCWELGAIAVSFVDAADAPVLEPLPGEFRLWSATRLQALFAAEIVPEVVIAALSQALQLSSTALRLEHVEDRAWEREWLRDFHAMRFGRRLWVCPHHEQAEAADAVIVRMDPGLAFGTGTHPSTALCLQWLDAHVATGQEIIDYGCGSGILALAAVKLGAARAHCFDIDPQALLATADNAQANDITGRISIVTTPADLPAQVDVLVANILSGPLRELAPALSARVRPGGSIVLAGLMDHEIGDVTQAYGAWFDMCCFGLRDSWAGLAGRRRSCATRSALQELGRG